MIIDLPTLAIVIALIALIALCIIGAGLLCYLARQPEPPLGYLDGEDCNREGCDGTIYDEAAAEGYSCYCMATPYPPCGICENPHEACDTCGWQARDEY